MVEYTSGHARLQPVVAAIAVSMIVFGASVWNVTDRHGLIPDRLGFAAGAALGALVVVVAARELDWLLDPPSPPGEDDESNIK